MANELFIWCWLNLHPIEFAKRSARLVLAAALVLLPLLYVNANLVRKGFRVTPPTLHIEAPQENLSEPTVD